MSNLRIGGYVPLSTMDYPNQLAAVVFCQGCAWRCSYCHNPHLLPSQTDNSVTWRQFEEFLHRRRGLLEAVVFSGGEPTQQKELVPAVQQVKAMGFHVGLHTAGIYPARLAAVLPWLDWVGMDIKAPFEDYTLITGVKHSGNQARESLQLILASGIEYECRTTVDTRLLTGTMVSKMVQELHDLGVRHQILQKCRYPIAVLKEDTRRTPSVSSYSLKLTSLLLPQPKTTDLLDCVL